MLHALFGLVVLIGLSTLTHAADITQKPNSVSDELNSVEAVQKVCDEALNHLSHGKIEEGLRILESNRLGKDEPQSKGFTENANKILHALEARYGKGLGHHLVREGTVGDFLHRREYLCKFERHLIYVELVLYKPETRWWIYSVNLHSQPDEYLPKVFFQAQQ